MTNNIIIYILYVLVSMAILYPIQKKYKSKFIAKSILIDMADDKSFILILTSMNVITFGAFSIVFTLELLLYIGKYYYICYYKSKFKLGSEIYYFNYQNICIGSKITKITYEHGKIFCTTLEYASLHEDEISNIYISAKTKNDYLNKLTVINRRNKSIRDIL